MKIEAMNWEEVKEEYTGGFRRRKGNGKMM